VVLLKVGDALQAYSYEHVQKEVERSQKEDHAKFLQILCSELATILSIVSCKSYVKA
jgi:hypothetical protein